MSIWLAALALGIALACAGSEPARSPVPVLQTGHGKPLDAAQGPLLIYLFATFDAASQAGVGPLKHLLSRYPRLRVVAIAIQPKPARLLLPWKHAVDAPFPVAHDPSGAVGAGTTKLGSARRVPKYVLLNARGEVVGHYTGLASLRRLEELLQGLDDQAQRVLRRRSAGRDLQ